MPHRVDELLDLRKVLQLILEDLNNGLSVTPIARITALISDIDHRLRVIGELD